MFHPYRTVAFHPDGTSKRPFLFMHRVFSSCTLHHGYGYRSPLLPCRGCAAMVPPPGCARVGVRRMIACRNHTLVAKQPCRLGGRERPPRPAGSLLRHLPEHPARCPGATPSRPGVARCLRGFTSWKRRVRTLTGTYIGTTSMAGDSLPVSEVIDSMVAMMGRCCGRTILSVESITI